MLPWFLAFGTSPSAGVTETRTETVTVTQQVAVETLEVKHTSGPGAKVGDRVTVRYKFESGGTVLVDSERMGVTFTFVLGDDDVPAAFQSGVKGLQLKGYRRARAIPSAFGDGFADRWPNLKTPVTFEITVVGLERPVVP
ncbi:MAG: FKBP-type peptidyl-prolyl cis-trans isomerase [Fimbriimonadaceae bacterium]